MTIASFIPAVSGMHSMAHAQQTVSENIANLTTTGYKTNETLFNSLLGSSGMNSGYQSGLSSSRADITGVNFYDRTNFGVEGVIRPTGNAFDVALSGNSNAFFTLDDGYGNLYFSRAGDFKKQAKDETAYLVSSGGLYLQGFQSIDGGDNFSSNLSDITFDPPLTTKQQPTTKASVVANVPASDVDHCIYSIRLYSENYENSNLHMIFDKIPGKENSWNLSFSTEDGVASSAQTEVIFSPDGKIKTPENLDVAINWNDGSSSQINIDISKMTQLGTNSEIVSIEQNGFPSGELISTKFDKDGVLRARYSNGHDINIAKLAITSFTSPENLTPHNTTLFEANGETGEQYFLTPEGLVVPQSLENSATDLSKEFSQMIVVQRAYSLNTQSFTVNNEMLSTAVDMKS